MRIFPLLLIGAPLAEIVTFGLVVQSIGFWKAFLLVLLTSAAGLLIVRQQGFGLVSKISGMARDGRIPATGLSADLMTLVAGLLLLIPGFLTDILGLLLLIPFVRAALARMTGVRSRVYTGPGETYTETYDFRGDARTGRTVDLDEGEFSRDGQPREDGETEGRLPRD